MHSKFLLYNNNTSNVKYMVVSLYMVVSVYNVCTVLYCTILSSNNYSCPSVLTIPCASNTLIIDTIKTSSCGDFSFSHLVLSPRIVCDILSTGITGFFFLADLVSLVDAFFLFFCFLVLLTSASSCKTETLSVTSKHNQPRMLISIRKKLRTHNYNKLLMYY